MVGGVVIQPADIPKSAARVPEDLPTLHKIIINSGGKPYIEMYFIIVIISGIYQLYRFLAEYPHAVNAAVARDNDTQACEIALSSP